MSEHLICRSDELVDGGAGVRFELAPKVSPGGTAVTSDPVPAFAIRHRGTVRAYHNRCGHIPVELDWQHGEFFDQSGLYLICATHGAVYAPESGRCLGGRCNGKGLQPVRVIERNGCVYFIGEGESGGSVG